MSNKKIKILIVEDDPAINSMYCHKFSNNGYSVDQAFDGKAGLQKCFKQKPDILLLDLKLPHMNGEELLKKVREHKHGAELITFILTNFSKDEAPSTLRMLNVERYFMKANYTPSQILDVLNETVKKYKLA